MFNSHYALMKEFASRLSVSGREHDFSNDLKAWMKPFADTVSTDAMGNLLLVKKTAVLDAPRLLLTAHMDQVGFMVTHIENNGYIRLSPVGSVNPIAYSNIPVKFSRGSKGILVAETNCKPEEMKPNKLYADIGTISLKETEKYVQVGDVCAIDVPLMKLKGSRIAGAALDNKASCAIIYKIAQLLSAEEALPFEVGFAFTVQEEVGCRGSKTIAYSFAPSYALNFDVTPCYDTIGSIPGNVRLGKGAAIKIRDNTVIVCKTIVDSLEQTAKEESIPIQREIIASGGSDTGVLQLTRQGVAAGSLSLPCRHIHTGTETIDSKDFDAIVQLALAWIMKGKVFEFESLG